MSSAVIQVIPFLWSCSALSKRCQVKVSTPPRLLDYKFARWRERRPLWKVRPMLASFIYRLALVFMRSLGWKFEGQKPAQKNLCCWGSHTSNWDFFITLALIGHFDLPLRYMVKNQVFRGPWAGLLKSLGSHPDRP